MSISLSKIGQSIRQKFSSEEYERHKAMAEIAAAMAVWNVKSWGESAVDLAQLAAHARMYSSRGDAIAKNFAFDAFVALYCLALPKLRYDSGAYWNRPGDETEINSEGRAVEKDCSKFHVGDLVIMAEGDVKREDFRLRTSFVDHSAPYRRALQEIVGNNAPPITDRKHAVFYQIFNSFGWYAGFMQSVQNPGTAHKLADILTQAARQAAKLYFGAHPTEKAILEQRGEKAPDTAWSRAQQYHNYGHIYCIRSDAKDGARVESLTVLPGSDNAKIIAAGQSDWETEQAAIRVQHQKTSRVKEAAASR